MIPANARMIKIDPRSGFFQIPIHARNRRFYGMYYNGRRCRWTRLPMGHPLAPSIMQRVSLAVARLLHRHYVTIVSYLDDWLIFSAAPIPVPSILRLIRQVGLQINESKSILTPTTSIVYLGLSIDTRLLRLQPTPGCIQHLRFLISLTPQAPHQDLLCITGYLSWLCYAMGWPTFIATTVLQRLSYWPDMDLHRLGNYSTTTTTSVAIPPDQAAQQQLRSVHHDWP
jgi:hypothetical protein